jgi:hypothetical protein
MARYRRGKKALYEVMSKNLTKPGKGKAVEPLQSKESKRKQQPTTVKQDKSLSTRKAGWRRTPSLFQLNASRIEISIPYQLAIALLLGLILIILVAFRLGQINQRANNPTIGTPEADEINLADRASARMDSVPTPMRELQPATGGTESTEATGDHVIVLVQYQQRSDLVPVQRYFTGYGIETEIFQQGGWYFLITKNTYDNPEKNGTNGYFAKQKIIQLGANYKAPPGYETFGKEPFHDAYGMKFEN